MIHCGLCCREIIVLQIVVSIFKSVPNLRGRLVLLFVAFLFEDRTSVCCFYLLNLSDDSRRIFGWSFKGRIKPESKSNPTSVLVEHRYWPLSSCGLGLRLSLAL